MKNKYQYLIVIAIVVIVYTCGFHIAYDQEALDIIYPEEFTSLATDDFTIKSANGNIIVGNSTFEDVEKAFPNGKILGMSTIYSLGQEDCLFSFTKKENTLNKIHISNNNIATSKGIQVGDSFAKVVEAYGSNYASVSKCNNKTDFDIVYGAEHTSNIFFHIRSETVAKIILQNEPVLKIN